MNFIIIIICYIDYVCILFAYIQYQLRIISYLKVALFLQVYNCSRWLVRGLCLCSLKKHPNVHPGRYRILCLCMGKNAICMEHWNDPPGRFVFYTYMWTKRQISPPLPSPIAAKNLCSGKMFEFDVLNSDMY